MTISNISSCNNKHHSNSSSYSCTAHMMKSAYCVGDCLPCKFRLMYSVLKTHSLKACHKIGISGLINNRKKKTYILQKCQRSVQLIPCHNTNRKHLVQHIFTFLSMSWATHTVQERARLHVYFIAFYIPLNFSTVGFCGTNAHLEMFTDSDFAMVLRKDKNLKKCLCTLWLSTLKCHKILNYN